MWNFDLLGGPSPLSNNEARRRLRVLCVSKDFAKRLTISSLLYFLVDFPTTIWIVFLNQLFKKVAEDPSEASTYAIIGLAVAIACSAASVLYKYFTRFVTSTPTDEQDLRLRKSTASLYVVFGFIFLVILFVSGLRDSESTEFAGLGFVGYFAAQALTMKSLLEFLPDLFDDDTFAVGWIWTFVWWQFFVSLLFYTSGCSSYKYCAALWSTTMPMIYSIAAVASQLVILALIWAIPGFPHRVTPDRQLPTTTSYAQTEIVRHVCTAIR